MIIKLLSLLNVLAFLAISTGCREAIIALPNSYSIQIDIASGRSDISYIKNDRNEVILSGVLDFTVEEHFVYGIIPATNENIYFILDTKDGSLYYPLSVNDYEEVLDEHNLPRKYLSGMVNIMEIQSRRKKITW